MTEIAPSAVPPQDPDNADLFDYQKLKHYFGFAIRALARRKLLATVVFVFVFGGALATLKLFPKSYHVETRILAQRNQVMPALGNPNRTVPGDADAPTRAAAEVILRRENLLALIKQTDLLNRWSMSRAPAVRLKDAVMGLISGPPSDGDRMDALVESLEKKLWVQTGDGTITIGIDWPDAQLAYRLIEAAQQNFLESRHQSEISSIVEAISILEGHAATVSESIDSMLADVEQKASATTTTTRIPSPPSPRRALAPPPPNPELAELKLRIDAKRQAIQDLDEFRQRHLAELQAKLVEQQAIYAPGHPVLIDLQQNIQAISRESPQVAALRAELKGWEDDYASRSARFEPAPAEPIAPSTPEPRQIRVRRDRLGELEDPALEYSRSRLQLAVANYNNLTQRIDGAKIELETARAGFKFRYTILHPPKLPKRATAPNIPLTIVAGLLAAALLSILAAVTADLRGGRILETWQIDRLLEVQVIGQVAKK